jgi:hypothetical protein
VVLVFLAGGCATPTVTPSGDLQRLPSGPTWFNALDGRLARWL